MPSSFPRARARPSNPSFPDYQLHVGLGGNSPIPGRGVDTFGAGFFQNGLSNDFEETLSPFLGVRDEKDFELFYNFAVTGWSKVTADLQFIDPFVVRSETRALFASRWQILF